MSSSEYPTSRVGGLGSEKRKFKDGALDFSRKRVKKFYNDRYHELYNSAVAGHFHSPSFGNSQFLSDSQIGSSVWTVAEKIAFFHVLARKGRHDLKAISIGLGSKSEPEIGQYIELLCKGLVDAELLFRRPLFLEKPEFEGAYEISPECMAFLDRAGDALSVLQQEQYEKVEQERQGKLWLLTPRIGRWVDKCLREGNTDEKKVSQMVPEATLLNLSCFLWLSKRFFMNSNDLEYNWSSFAEKSEEPAILHTAFTDFYTLALDTIRRLIQSTLHFAISRLRAEKRSNDRKRSNGRRHRCVMPQDVAAALNVLDMRGSMKTYWVGVPRRCNLRVFEDDGISHVTGKGLAYSHDEVEVLLTSHQRVENENDPLVELEDDATIEEQSSARSDIQPLPGTDLEHNDTDSSEFRDGSPLSQQDEEAVGEDEGREQHYDEILERVDRRKSQAEEKRLWELLGEDVALELDSVDVEGSLESLVAVRKDKADLVDWTSCIDYGAEWERVESPVHAGKS